jgi:hypothetical protein
MNLLSVLRSKDILRQRAVICSQGEYFEMWI